MSGSRDDAGGLGALLADELMLVRLVTAGLSRRPRPGARRRSRL